MIARPTSSRFADEFGDAEYEIVRSVLERLVPLLDEIAEE
jgi:hypothetical protein